MALVIFAVLSTVFIYLKLKRLKEMMAKYELGLEASAIRSKTSIVEVVKTERSVLPNVYIINEGGAKTPKTNACHGHGTASASDKKWDDSVSNVTIYSAQASSAQTSSARDEANADRINHVKFNSNNNNNNDLALASKADEHEEEQGEEEAKASLKPTCSFTESEQASCSNLMIRPVRNIESYNSSTTWHTNDGVLNSDAKSAAAESVCTAEKSQQLAEVVVSPVSSASKLYDDSVGANRRPSFGQVVVWQWITGAISSRLQGESWRTTGAVSAHGVQCKRGHLALAGLRQKPGCNEFLSFRVDGRQGPAEPGVGRFSFPTIKQEPSVRKRNPD